MLATLKKRLPQATICRYDGVDGTAMSDATKTAFGESARQVLSLEDADVIVAIQADILGNHKGMVPTAASFAKRRDPIAGDMSRLYVVEGGYSSTGAAADSRLALRPSQMPAFLSELARRIEKLAGGDADAHSGNEAPFDQINSTDRLERFLDVLAHDIAEAGDKAVVIVGDHLGADAIVAGIKINQRLGSLGKLQKFLPTGDAVLGENVSIGQVVEKINAGDIDTLLILGDNPVVTAPGDVDLATAIGKVEHSIYLGEYDDETSLLCEWSLPLAHPLESWGDCVNDHGHYGVCQPQILPLLGGRAACEVLAVILGERETEGSEIVRRTADGLAAESLSERQWRKLLHDGFAANLDFDFGDFSAGGDAQELTAKTPRADAVVDKDEMEVIFVPADGIYDGRFANNGWLQEMPQSLTKMTWDNAAIMSPATAKALGLQTRSDGGTCDGRREGRIACLRDARMCARCGHRGDRLRPHSVPEWSAECRQKTWTSSVSNVSPIRTSDAMLVAYNVEARPRFTEYELATTQDHWAIDERGRDETEVRSFSLVREGTTELLEKSSEFAEAKGPHVPNVGQHGSPWTEPINAIEEKNKAEHKDVPQWGMSIDLSKCIGCNACVIACQSENNVPIVGREQVQNSREMHWLRVDRYFQGDEENADIVQEPVACMHCETAPCEQVCPVAATVHTDEGINAMAYNRCIGTRYCANNCPFKVRRFNYFNYNETIGVGIWHRCLPEPIENANRKLQALVHESRSDRSRSRGDGKVHLLCPTSRTGQDHCSQRGSQRSPMATSSPLAKSACPTRAIEFGNIADPESVVSKKRADVRSYGMLGQLNVKPRTEYLARVRNPHKRLMTANQLEDLVKFGDAHGGHGHSDQGHDDHAHADDAHDDHGHADEAHDDQAHDDHKPEAAASQEKKD